MDFSKINELKPYDLNCNIFDVYSYNGLSMQELLCQFFTKINDCIKTSNETIDLAEWLVNEGLKQEVALKLTQWLNDGTLENIINVTLFENLNNKINNVSSQLERIESDIYNNVIYFDSVIGDNDDEKMSNILKQNSKTIYFSDKLYTFNTQHIISENFKFIGKSNTVIHSTLTSGYLFTIKGSNTEFKNIIFTGLNTNTGQGCLNLYDDFTDLKVKNCIFDGFNSAILARANNKNITISECVFKNANRVIDDIPSGYGVIFQGSENTLIEKCIFEKTINRHGIYVSVVNASDYNSKCHSIINNVFYGRTDVNTFETGYEYPLKVMSSEDVLISNNKFYNGCGSILLSQYYNSSNVYGKTVDNIIIRDNFFYNILRKSQAHSVIHCADRTSKMKNLIVQSNIVNAKTNFMIINEINGGSISDNKIVLNSDGLNIYALFVYNIRSLENLTIKDNNINVPTNQRCIQIQSSVIEKIENIYIKNNIFSGGYYSVCLKLNEGSLLNNVVFDGNNLSQSSTGISFENTVYNLNNVVFSNNITNSNGAALSNSQTGIVYDHNNTVGFVIGTSEDLYRCYETVQKLKYCSGVKVPVTETWSVGDRVVNRSAKIYQPKSWICTVAGSPGTWKSEGNIE